MRPCDLELADLFAPLDPTPLPAPSPSRRRPRDTRRVSRTGPASHVCVYIPAEELGTLRKEVAAAGVSVSEYVRSALALMRSIRPAPTPARS